MSRLQRQSPLRGKKWISDAVLIAASALIVVGAAFGVGQGGSPDTRPPKTQTVRLIIDYNDGVEKHFTAVPWKKGMTVRDAMDFAKRSPHGIAFEHKGRGETALLTRIDDLANQGGGSGKNNWIYRVNDKLANKGFAVFELNPSDVVLWKFTTYSIGG
ncbi:MAG: DUF4430 domain-containing protein [Planctomycetota bacterium]|nr:DUF4430 domain-containing protein [Planctomycetota bacterium]